MSDIFSHKGKYGRDGNVLPRVLSLALLVVILCFARITMATSFDNPLIDAADLGDTTQVVKLLKEGTNPDIKGDFGVTALMRAAYRGNTDIIQALIEGGAYVNAADVGGETPLHLAAKNGHTEAVKALLYYGAYIDVPDKENWTPLMRATLSKQADTVQVLIDKGADIAAVNNINESVLVHAAISGIPDIAAIITGSKQAKKITKDQENMAIGLAKRKNHADVEKVITMFMDKQGSQSSSQLADLQPLKPQDDKKPEELKPIDVKPVEDQTQDKTAAKIPRYSSIAQNSKEDKPVVVKAPEEKPAELKPLEERPVAIKPVEEKSVAPKPAEEKVAIAKLEQDTPAIAKKTEEKSVLDEPVKEKPVVMKSTEEKPLGVAIPVVDALVYNKNGAFYVQLGNFDDEGGAQKKWEKTLPDNTEVLSKLSPTIVKAKLEPGRDVYRLRAGRIATKKEADDTCRAMRSKNYECVVVEVSDTTSFAKADSVPSVATQPEPPKPAVEEKTPDLAGTVNPSPSKTEPEKLNTSKKIVSSAPLPASSFSGSYPKLADSVIPNSLPNMPPLANIDTSPLDINSTDSMLPPPSLPAPTPGTVEAPATAPMQEAASTETLPWHTDAFKAEQKFTDVEKPVAAGVSSQPMPNAVAGLPNDPNASPFPSQQQAPVNNFPAPVRQDESFVENKNKMREEVQEMTRANFFRKQGVEAPARKKKEYDDFYKQMEDTPNKSTVSEAVLVPDETYFSDTSQQSMGGGVSDAVGDSWLSIDNLPSKEFADDYAARMFKSDESLGNVQVRVTKSSTGLVAVKVGPLPSAKVDVLCGAVRSGGYSCTAVTGSGAPAPSYRAAQGEQVPVADASRSMTYWINLGTFSNESEAEYYWMLMKEDNGDILGQLQYSVQKAPESSEFGTGAVKLRTGPFSIKQRATQICSIMRYRNIACLLTE